MVAKRTVARTVENTTKQNHHDIAVVEKGAYINIKFYMLKPFK